VQVTHPKIAVRGLPEGISGFRIAVLADVHHSPIVPLSRVRRVVDLANAAEADLIALVGDYVWNGPRHIGPVFAQLARLRARHGVIAVLGNHDHWDGAPETRERMAAAGIADLTNRNVRIETPRGSFQIAGLDDPWAGAPKVEQALAGIRAATGAVMLCHQPVAAELMIDDRVSLMIAGHTHGGQVVLPFIGPIVVPGPRKYVSGLVQGPRCPVYISRGIAYAGVPLRINCPAELPIITLLP